MYGSGKINSSSRYYKLFRTLRSKISSQNVFRLVYNNDKETYHLPYLYADYKNDLEPITISNKIFNSVKELLEDNLFNIEEKKFIISELMPFVKDYGNDTIQILNRKIESANNQKQYDTLINEYEKTIISLKQINEIINSHFLEFHISLLSQNQTLPLQQMKNTEQIEELILNEFRKTNSKENHIIMMRTYRFSVIPKLNPKEQELFYTVANNLIDDGFIKYEDASSGPECFRLTKKGYDRIYDENYSKTKSDGEKKINTESYLPKIVILTAILEEYLAVQKHIKNLEEISINDTEYESGIFEFEGNNIAQIIIRECGARNTIASQETERAIQNFKPDCLFFVGIAGSRKPNDFQIGDVIFPEKIYYYEGGKSEKDSFKARTDIANTDFSLSEIAKKERRKNDWKTLIKGKYEKDVSANLGVIASGEKIIEHYDSEIGKILTTHHNDTSAVEMEGFGFAKASMRQGRETKNMIVGVVRGISDILGQPNKNESSELSDRRPDNNKIFASDTAAAFTYWLIYKLYKYKKK